MKIALLKNLLLFLFVIKDYNVIAQKKNFKNYIPSDYSVLDSSTGDFNSDGITDIAIILKHINEDSLPDLQRPLLILFGTNVGLKLYARNDNVILCKKSGGLFGDPFQGITIAKSKLVIEFFGGHGKRWLRVIEFKYYKTKKKFLLYSDKGAFLNENMKFYHSRDFGILDFDKYNYRK